jgi:hypothetical protein
MESQGFTSDEIEGMVDRAQADFQRTQLLQARRRVIWRAITTVTNGIQAGIMSDEDARQALQSLNWPPEFADAFVQILRQQEKIGLVKSATARIKSAYIKGEIDDSYAQTTLITLGVQADQAALFIAVWNAERTPSRKRRSASQIAKDVAAGNLDTATALVMLANLGYNDADQRLYLADAAANLLRREQQGLQTEFRTEQELVESLLLQLRAGGRQSQQLRNSLRKFVPQAKLDKWASLGLIDESRYTEIMGLFGYDTQTIALYYAAACSGKSAKCQPTTGTVESSTPGGNGHASATV